MLKSEAWEDDLVEAVGAVSQTTRHDPCPPEETWVALLSGEVGEEEAERLRVHLAACPECVETARDAGRFLAAMGEFGRKRRTGATFRPWLATAAALVVVGIGVVVAVRVMQPDPLAPWTRGEVTPPAAEAGPIDSELVFRGGQTLDQALPPYRVGDWTTAERTLGAYIAANPSDLRAAFYRGAALLAAGRPAEARAPLVAATGAADPALVAEARWYLALACLRAGDRGAAAQALAPLRHRAGPHAAEVESLAAALERAR